MKRTSTSGEARIKQDWALCNRYLISRLSQKAASHTSSADSAVQDHFCLPIIDQSNPSSSLFKQFDHSSVCMDASVWCKMCLCKHFHASSFTSVFQILLIVLLCTGAAVAQPNLYVRSKINTTHPNLNDLVSYTLVVSNDGSAAATGVVVENKLAAGAVYDSHAVLRGANAFASNSGLWSVGSLAAGDSVVLELKAKVVARGVWFNTTEIMAMNETDPNSIPGNNNLLEDDYGSVCFSVPIYWFPGDEYTVTLPGNLTNIQWTRNGNPLSTQSPSDSAVVTGNSLVIKGPGQYAFTALSGNCQAGACCMIEIIPGICNVEVSVAARSVCEDSPLSLSAAVTGGEAPYTYAWTGPGSFTSTLPNPAIPVATTANAGVYTLKVTDVNGCTAVSSTTVAVGLLPTAACNSPVCEGSPATFSATAGAVSYRWYGPNGFFSTSQKPIITQVTPADAGSYTVVVTGVEGCTGTAVTTLMVLPKPVVSAFVSATACVGNAISLSAVASGAPGPYQYVWNGPNGFYASEQNPTIANAQLTNSGSYTVTVVGKNGCSSQAVTTPVAVTTCDCTPQTGATPGVVCVGGSVSLTATGGYATYRWSGPNGFVSSAQNPTLSNVSASASGTYSVMVTDGKGCVGVSSVAVVVNALPVAQASSSTACQGSLASIQLSAMGGSSYQWAGPNGFMSSLQNPAITNASAANSGIYSVTISNGSGCVAVASTSVTVGNCAPPVACTPQVGATPGVVCVGGSVSLTATGGYATYRWSGPNGFVSSAQNPTLSNVSASASGTYSVTVTDGSGCVGVSSVAVVVNALPIAVASSGTVCQGSLASIQLSATGGSSYQWSGPNGFVSSLQNPAITNASAANSGVYSVSVSSGSGCTSVVSTSVTVGSCVVPCADKPAPPVIVCATTHICPGDQIVLQASSCEGTVVWSTGQTGSNLVVSPTLSTTYTAQCKVGNCLSDPSKPIVISVSDPQPPTVTADADTVCAGSSVRLTATGCEDRVIWSTGQTGSSILVTPEGTTAYYANCRINNCISNPSQKITIHTSPLPTPKIVGSTNQICLGGTLTLTAQNCTGTPVWSTGETGGSIVVAPRETTFYTVTCKKNNCASPVSPIYSVSVSKPQPPMIDVSADTVCLGGQVQLTAMGCAGTITWSTGATGANISVSVNSNTTFKASCLVGGCQSEWSTPVSVVVANPAAPIIKVTKTMICAGEEVTLTAQGCENGLLVWSNSMYGSSITIKPGATTTYVATCKIHSCTSGASNALTVNVTNSNAPVPTVVASKTAICKGEPVTLTATGCASGTIVWSTGQMGSTLVVTPVQTTEYYAACRVGTSCNSNPAKVTIQVNTPETPRIRVCKCTDGRICLGDTIRLSAYGCSGTPVWSNGATTSSIVVSPTVTTQYTVSCRNATCISEPSPAYTVTVGIPAPPVITASQAKVDPETTVTLSATGCANGTIIWSTGATGSSIMVTPTVTTSYFAQCRVNGCLSEPTSTTVRVKGDCDVPAPTVTASATSVCSGGSVTLTATGCTSGTVVWSNQMTGSSIVINNLTASGFYTAACKESETCSSAQAIPIRVSVVVANPPTIAATKRMLCPGDTARLTAIGCAGLVTWSTGATGNSILIQPKATTQYWATCTVGGCSSDRSALSTIKVGTPEPPKVTANITAVCLGGTTTLTASGCEDGTILWSNQEVGPNLVIAPTTSATFTAICRTSDGCVSTSSNGIAVTVYPVVPQPKTINITNLCPVTTDNLMMAVSSTISQTNSVFEFYTSSTPVLAQKVANPQAVPAGVYYVFEKTASGCYSLPATIVATVTNCNDTPLCLTNPASVTAGPDARICAAKLYKLNGMIGGAANSATWTTSGTGTFDNATLLNAAYTPSLADMKAGSVMLTLMTNDPDGSGSCQAAKSSMRLIISGIQVLPSIYPSATMLCNGDSVVLKAMPDGYQYVWNNKATTQSIVVKTSGTYSVQLMDNQGCTSLPSEAVTITVREPIESPIAPMMARNSCPANTINLMRVVESAPRTAGGVLEYHIGNTPSSPIVLRPDSVGKGVYYVFERSRANCYSEPTPIEVSVFNCPDTCFADLYITKTVDKAHPKVGDLLTFTIKYGNKGGCAATHSDIRDILPQGLELVSPGNLVVDAHGHLGAWLTVLAPNEEITYYYTARLVTQGPIVNTAEIIYLDQVDPNLSNNQSSVTIQDTARVRPAVIGLAKSLKKVQQHQETLFEFTYDLAITNYSNKDARQVQISDDVQSVFDPHVIEAVYVSLDSSTTLKRNSRYTGWVGQTQLLDTASVLKAGATQHILLRVNVRTQPDGSLTKTFYNQAFAVAKLDTITVSDASTNGSSPDPDQDGNPNNDSSPTPAKFQYASQLGVALAVAGVETKADSSYDVTYKVTIQNYGATTLKQVQLSDSLLSGFASPVTYRVVSGPVVGTGSGLVPNASYSGVSNPALLDSSSTLGAGAKDTLLITLNIKPNGSTGPFYTQVVGKGYAGDTLVTDLSNNGFNPQPLGSVPTGVRFDLPGNLIGLAKAVSKLEDQGNGIFKVTYTLRLTNYGMTDLHRVQLMDDLTSTFGNDVVIGPEKPVVTADAGLVVDSTYTGQGMLTNLLIDSLSSLPWGSTRTVNLTVRVDVHNSLTATFNNLAIARALNGAGVVTADTSTLGTNPDPDNDLDPRNNSTVTSVTLDSQSGTPRIGVALAVRDTVRQADGSYHVTYQIVVKNYSRGALTHVQLIDELSAVFNASSGASYSVVAAPMVSAGSQLSVNAGFNGDTDARLLAGNSQLLAAQSDTIWMLLHVQTDGRSTPYLNQVYALALAGADTVRDASTDGMDPDLNQNNDPTESSEAVATPLWFKGGPDAIFIPEGFSPNGDGKNDLFVISNTGAATVRLEVFNRWGSAVYRSDDYRNDWDGTSNTGLRIGSGSKGLPEGTYFYVVELSDGRRYVRFMTINR